MLDQDTDQIIKAIQQAADAAATKGVAVKVEISANGFFPTERMDVTITATPIKDK